MKLVALLSLQITAMGPEASTTALARVPAGRSSGVYTPRKACGARGDVFGRCEGIC
jgi:hypothetical protein